MKVCTKCKIETPNSMMVQSGKSSWCKQCSKEYVTRFRGTPRGKAYSIYYDMLHRCYNPKATRYEKYGGAGVVVVDEWLGEDGFNTFFAWWEDQPENSNPAYQLDKDIYCNDNGIKPHKYSPETCQFVSRSENQRNYSDLLKNNTSGYTGVTLNKNKVTWDFRLHREHAGNINRSGFKTSLEAAKAREAFIIVNNLDFKLEHVGSSMSIDERPEDFTYFYSSSNYNCIRQCNGKFTGVINMPNKSRKSIGVHLTAKQAAEVRNDMIRKLNVSELNALSYLFGYGPITKEP